MINRDIERLNKLKQSSHRNKESNYFYELNDFIENIKKKRDNQNNGYINVTNENKEKLLELKKDIINTKINNYIMKENKKGKSRFNEI